MTVTCNLPVHSGGFGYAVTLGFLLAALPCCPPHSLDTAEHFGSTTSCVPVLTHQ